MRRFFRRWPAQSQRGIFASLFEPFLDLAYPIKQPHNPSDQFSNIPLFQPSSIPTFHYSIFYLRLCRTVSPVVSELARWEKNGKKEKILPLFHLHKKEIN
jgi:hypothetical protein